MKKIIVYGSRYGSAKKYARWLAEQENVPLYPYTDVTSELLKDAEVLYFGAVYASTPLGLKTVLKGMQPAQPIKIFTVGLTDPKASDQLIELQQKIREDVHKASVSLEDLYHLRGAFDYEKLTLPHKLLIKTLNRSIKKKENINATDRLFMEAYTHKVDFTDLDQLEQLEKSG